MLSAGERVKGSGAGPTPEAPPTTTKPKSEKTFDDGSTLTTVRGGDGAATQQVILQPDGRRTVFNYIYEDGGKHTTMIREDYDKGGKLVVKGEHRYTETQARGIAGHLFLVGLGGLDLYISQITEDPFRDAFAADRKPPAAPKPAGAENPLFKGPKVTGKKEVEK